MNEFSILMVKLSKLTILTVEKNVITTVEGFTVSYSLELNSSKSMLPSVQMLLSVRYEGQQVIRWGCMGEQDQQQLVDFFLKASFDAVVEEGKLANVYKKLGIELFEKL